MKNQAHYLLVKDPITEWGKDMTARCGKVVLRAEWRMVLDLGCGLLDLTFNPLRNCPHCHALIKGEIGPNASGYLYAILPGQETKTEELGDEI